MTDSASVPTPAGTTDPADVRSLEFDLHGIVGVRIEGARADEAAGVRAQLGPIEARLDRDPDLVIRFVDELDDTEALYVEPGEASFGEDDFTLLRGRRGQRTSVSIPFDAIGNGCVISCRRGTIGVPLLLQIVNMTALGRGMLPLHASAFVYEGRCVLVTGWAKGGKSETLLAFAEQGASYLGDEWIYLDPASGAAHGIPEPMRLWAWHVRAGATYRERLGRGRRAKLRALQLGVDAAEGVLRRAGGHRRLASILERSVPILRRQASVQVPPSLLFGDRPPARPGIAVDHLVFAVSHTSDAVVCEATDAAEIATRMTASLEYERRDLTSAYLQYRFAFPSRRSPLMERAAELEAQLLHRALDRLPAVTLRHPYPVAFHRLFDALAPHLVG